MKRSLIAFLTAGLIASGLACAAEPAPKAPELKTDDDKTFYALGLVIAGQLSGFRLSPAELELVKSGITDGTLKNTPKVELDAYGPKIRPLAEARQNAGAAEEKKKGAAFIETVSKKPNVKKTASGALYEVVTEGKGTSPTATDTVKVNYKGTLIGGLEFDSSAKNGGPAQFRLDQVIKCWTEGLQTMKPGGKVKLYCPAEIAYGDRPKGEIPAGSTLVFDVELLEVVKQDAPK